MRRYRRRSTRTRTPVQSFKKVLNYAPGASAAGNQNVYTAVVGTDSVAAGQTSAVDTAVPTGAVITSIDIQASFSNLVSIAGFIWVTVQHLRSGQTSIDNQAVGGNPQRNQVHLQLQRSLGKDQNRDIIIPFKIPKKFGRVREGDQWVVALKSDILRTETVQMIYKFYR